MLMHDAGSNFDALSAIVYADDTLLLATSDGHVQEFLLESPMLKSYTNTANTVSSFIGKSFSYFSSMHSYTEGEDIESTPDINYLGPASLGEVCPDKSLLAESGCQQQTLLKVWQDSSLPAHRKVCFQNSG